MSSRVNADRRKCTLTPGLLGTSEPFWLGLQTQTMILKKRIVCLQDGHARRAHRSVASAADSAFDSS